jgi:hypothetical protein
MWTSASHIRAGARTTSTELVFRDYPPFRHYVAEQHQALKRRPAKEFEQDREAYNGRQGRAHPRDRAPRPSRLGRD